MNNPLCFVAPSNRKEATAWVRLVSREIGLGFHPDTRAADYINVETREPTFSKEEATAFDKALDCAFELLGDNIYQHGLAVQRRLLKGA